MNFVRREIEQRYLEKFPIMKWQSGFWGGVDVYAYY